MSFTVREGAVRLSTARVATKAERFEYEDYDGDCFVGCQMFFDFKKTPNIKAALKAEVDPDEFTLKLASEPVPVRGYKRIAVKVAEETKPPKLPAVASERPEGTQTVVRMKIGPSQDLIQFLKEHPEAKLISSLRLVSSSSRKRLRARATSRLQVFQVRFSKTCRT